MTYAHNGDCEIWYETFGSASNPTLVLVNGLGSQCINYPIGWCEKFAARDLQVIRLDNRDVGLSTKFESHSVDETGACYRLSDMAADVIAVLDAVNVDRAHVMGLSMGGMIVQTMAIERPERLLTMTSVMSNTGEPGIGIGTQQAIAQLTAPPATDRESYVKAWIDGLHVWGSPEFADEERWRANAESAFDRCFHPSGPGRQYMAVGASGSRADQLRVVTVPTLVIHGSCDTLITSDGGRRTAELIPGARFELIDGMGHDYPPQLWDMWVEMVADHAARHFPSAI